MVAMGNERDVDIAYIAEAKDIRGLENPGDEVIVQIDTGDRTGHLRVMLNEAVLFDDDPELHGVTPEQKLLISTFHRVSRFEADAMQLAIDLGVLRSDLAGRAREVGLKL
ncbi:hypothetical protein PBI_HYPERION_78 [Microbacterium phage Hyperion]|uniref:Uncharacterized protein n=1 Tax=Microbacterium phage Hyperion TaxID=2182354 RepID=A0A2U8UIZ6_9CAUD|nr:hypothetical protein HOT27_gp078 [Microbacterium phage Hyperion]AWN03593.1 hypothetical protein PBI_HYPERION_78 [Microbacterium phage Hyperion]QXN74002.1 hypothetical protein SEA_BLAB_76 [Microbacterium phage Blab]UJD20811.1 hypothetical protein SEA_ALUMINUMJESUS_76 [Microbacterium phage AluminumJesus]